MFVMHYRKVFGKAAKGKLSLVQLMEHCLQWLQ